MSFFEIFPVRISVFPGKSRYLPVLRDAFPGLFGSKPGVNEDQYGMMMEVLSVAQEVYDRFPGFRLKDAGYSQFSQFADGIEGVRVVGENRQRVKLA